jgi:lysophospholipase L1-like esterase
MPSTQTDRLNGLTTSVAVKPPCVAVTTAPITLSGLQTIGGVTLSEGDRVLVRAQANSVDNGIYNASTGSWVRASDFDGNRDVTQGTLVLVRTNSVDGAIYEQTTASPVIGTSAIVFELRDDPAITYVQTLAEIDALVTPASYAYSPEYIERQGSSTAAADNLLAINRAITTATRPNINVQRPFMRSGDGTFIVSAPPTNPYGIDLAGTGAIMEQFSAYSGTFYRQLNSYANNFAGPPVLGREYLYHLYNKLIANAGTGIILEAYGDSTVAGGNGESSLLLIQTLFPNLGFRAGLPEQLYVTNHAVGGTSWTDFDPSAELTAGTMDVLIVKYGINDGSKTYATRLATMVTAMRAALATIRAHANGGLDTLSIVLVGPTSTYDAPNQRDAYWYEQLRGAYVQAARDYQCLYVDAYAMLQDARYSAGLDMDAPYADDRTVHPLNERLLWLWPAVFRAMFGWEETRFLGRNNFLNLSASMTAGSAAASNVPTDFAFGISMYRATVANGWPIEGMLFNVRNADGPSLQMLCPFGDANRTQIPKRLAYVAGNTWTQWSGIANAMTLANSWVAFGGGFDSPQYILGENGIVTCTGAIKNGTTTAGTTIATLPAGYRPPATQGPIIVATNAGSCQMKIDTSGNIQLQTAGDATYTSMHFSFRAA